MCVLRMHAKKSLRFTGEEWFCTFCTDFVAHSVRARFQHRADRGCQKKKKEIEKEIKLSVLILDILSFQVFFRQAI